MYLDLWRNWENKYETVLRFHIGKIDWVLYIGDGNLLKANK